MTVKIDIISGFLGAGKTTLINRILDDVLTRDKVAIVENEFGEIGVDGRLFKESGVEVMEVSGGCICCTLFGDFVSALKKLITQVQPDRIIVEPTGVGKMTDVLKAVEAVGRVESIKVNMLTAIVDPLKYDMYSKMFGDFYKDQIQTARTIMLSRTQLAEKSQVENAVNSLLEQNHNARIITKPWDDLTGAQIVAVCEVETGDPGGLVFEPFIEHNHHHEHHHENEHIKVWSTRTSNRYSREQFQTLLGKLDNERVYGTIVRGKGFFQTPEGYWLRYDYVPGEISFYVAPRSKLRGIKPASLDLRSAIFGSAENDLNEIDKIETGEIVFIGKDIDCSAFERLFDQ